MSLYHEIILARPGIDPANFDLRDNGAGPYIAAWRDASAKPTKAELAAVRSEANKAPLVAQVKSEAARRILAAVPEWKQRNAALGLYDSLTTDAIKSAVDAIRTASNTLEAEIVAGSWTADPKTWGGWPI